MQQYPRPPRRPQASRVRLASRQPAQAGHGGSTWVFCLVALALVAGLVGVDPSGDADAASALALLAGPTLAQDGVQVHD